jgi:peroxiredoxin Q/BCP
MHRISRLRSAFALGAWILVAVFTAAVGAAADLVVGDPAPDFALPGTDGTTHRLADSVGDRGVVLAWFPKAFTPG